MVDIVQVINETFEISENNLKASGKSPVINETVGIPEQIKIRHKGHGARNTDFGRRLVALDKIAVGDKFVKKEIQRYLKHWHPVEGSQLYRTRL